MPRIQLVAPTSTDERIDALRRATPTAGSTSSSLTGTTGARAEVSPALAGLVERTRAPHRRAALRRLRDLDARARGGRGRARRRRRRRLPRRPGRRGGAGRAPRLRPQPARARSTPSQLLRRHPEDRAPPDDLAPARSPRAASAVQLRAPSPPAVPVSSTTRNAGDRVRPAARPTRPSQRGDVEAAPRRGSGAPRPFVLASDPAARSILGHDLDRSIARSSIAAACSASSSAFFASGANGHTGSRPGGSRSAGQPLDRRRAPARSRGPSSAAAISAAARLGARGAAPSRRCSVPIAAGAELRGPLPAPRPRRPRASGVNRWKGVGAVPAPATNIVRHGRIVVPELALEQHHRLGADRPPVRGRTLAEPLVELVGHVPHVERRHAPAMLAVCNQKRTA